MFIPFEFVFIKVIEVLVLVVVIIRLIWLLLALVTEIKEWDIIRLVINMLSLFLPWWSSIIFPLTTAFLTFIWLSLAFFLCRPIILSI